MNESHVRVTLVKIKVGGRYVEIEPRHLETLGAFIDGLIGKTPEAPIVKYDAPERTYIGPDFLIVDPNSEEWPCSWGLEYGPLRQSATLIIG